MRAMLLAGMALCWKSQKAEFSRRANVTWKQLWFLLTQPKQWQTQENLERASLRLNHCGKCSLFNRRLQTCGTPGEFLEDGQPFGCFCFLPAAVVVETKTCWLDDKELDGGWNQALGSKK